MAGGRYEERVRDLLADAQAAADRMEWQSVRALAGAALALEPDCDEAIVLMEASDGATATSGERRQLTVMFCDVVGSTLLSQNNDPELVREVLRSYQVTCDRVVRRYEGRIARYIGDGVLAYFGHPVAHEDDARRGVKAGLDLLDALRPVTEEIRGRYGVELSIRVAVHTGLVVRADMGSVVTPDRDAIVGDTPNIAARLQDHATPGTMIISQDTYELVRPWFLVSPLGPVELKGIDEPMRSFEVVEENHLDSRVFAQADLSPFVGREEELGALAGAWTDVVAGGSATVAITGQPGVGKSRLADVLRRRAEVEDITTLMASCSSYHGATALYPVRRLLERVAGIDSHQEAHLALPRLWGAMEGVGQAEALPYVADLLGLPPTAWCPAPELDGAVLREQLLTTLVAWLAALARRNPVLLIVDDLQWTDPTTLELMGRLVANPVPGLLLVVTARDDVKVPWPSAIQIPLDRLSVAELADLARRLPEGRALSDEALDRVIDRSDGIPLFLEELLRSSALVQGDAPSTTTTIPSALRDLLLARFAAPGVDLRLAQVVATIGTEAALPVIADVTRLPEDRLHEQLAALVDAGILTVVPGDPLGYRFRHHLLADLAYDTQLQAARRSTHSAVADALLAEGSSTAAIGPAVVAHHLERASRPGEAIVALVEAAEAAHSLGANAEVAELLERAFVLLEVVDDDARAEREFSIRLVRGVNAASIMGFAAPQAADDFQACRDLMSRIHVEGHLDDGSHGDASIDLAWAGSGLWANFMLQGRLEDALEVNLSIVERLHPDGDLHAYFASAPSFLDFFRGDYVAAEAGMALAHELFDRIELSPRASVPNHPAVANLAHLGFLAAVRGRFDEARQLSDESFEVAESVPFPIGPFSHCYALTMRSAIDLMVADEAAALERAQAAAAIAERHGFTFWTIVAGYYLAILDAEDPAGATSRARLSISLLQALGVRVWLPSFLGAVSAAHLRRGEAGPALEVIREAQAVTGETGAHFWSAELIRQEGEALLALGEDGGLDRLREAVDLAVQQGATLLELWARTSLCRHAGAADDHEGLRAVATGLDPALADVAVAWEVLGAAGIAP